MSSAATKARKLNRREALRVARPVSHVRCRFVYEDEIKGEWVNLLYAVEANLHPDEDHKVIRVEFDVVGTDMTKEGHA